MNEVAIMTTNPYADKTPADIAEAKKVSSLSDLILERRGANVACCCTNVLIN